MTRIPRAHRFYLRKNHFPLSEEVLARVSPREAVLLARDGHWLEALAAGKINPITEAQQRFVMVARGHRVPQSRHEIAWSKRCDVAPSLSRRPR